MLSLIWFRGAACLMLLLCCLCMALADPVHRVRADASGVSVATRTDETKPDGKVTASREKEKRSNPAGATAAKEADNDSTREIEPPVAAGFINGQMHRPTPVILAIASLAGAAAGAFGLTSGHSAPPVAAASGSASTVTPFAQTNAVPNPEPATLLLFGSGLAAVAGLIRRKNRRQHA